MAATPRPDDLAPIYARLAAQEAELTRLKRRRRLPRRFLPLALAVFLVALVPLATLAANPVFSDLGDAAAVHQPNIQAIGNAGITTGFDDPAHPGQRTYNPKGNVTREEMASFLARTAGLNGNPPVVNALTAVNATNAQTAVTAQTATSATTAQTATNATNAINAQIVPDGSVTAAKLSPTGSTTGQSLVSTGTGVQWQSTPNLVGLLYRDYSGSVPVTVGTDTTLTSTQVTIGSATIDGIVVLQTTGGGTGFCYLSGDTRFSIPYNVQPNTRLTLPLNAIQAGNGPWTLAIVCHGDSGSVTMEAGSAKAVTYP